eukprot:scaffold324701_cov32-Attheya_sp.AAC.1
MLVNAIETCTEAATKEFDIAMQKRLLRAASYGMHFAYKDLADTKNIMGGSIANAKADRDGSGGSPEFNNSVGFHFMSMEEHSSSQSPKQQQQQQQQQNQNQPPMEPVPCSQRYRLSRQPTKRFYFLPTKNDYCNNNNVHEVRHLDNQPSVVY